MRTARGHSRHMLSEMVRRAVSVSCVLALCNAGATQAHAATGTSCCRCAQNDPGFPYPEDTIYDAVQDGSHQIALSTWLQSHSSTQSEHVDITFNDGGKLRMHWQASQIDFTLTEAFDRNNNPIPLHIGDLIGHYDFTGGGGDDFVAFLQDRYGAGVQVPVNVCRNGVLACSSGGGVVSCQWIHCGAIP